MVRQHGLEPCLDGGSAASPNTRLSDGILLQQWDHAAGKLVGPGEKTSSRAAQHGLVEAPHLFKRNGWYFLTTGRRRHRLRSCRHHAAARRIDGPYELHPLVHPITSKDAPDAVFAAGRSWPDRRDAGRPDLSHASLLASAARHAALAARSRDGDPEMRLG